MIHTFNRNPLRSMILGLAIGLTGVANAGEVHLVGSAFGQFDAQAFAPSNSLLALAYSGSTFDNTTVGGTLDLGGNPSPGSNFNNLGSLTLGNTNDNYNGHTFDLQVTFTAPMTIVGGTMTTFTSVLSGIVQNQNGGVFVDFDNTPQTFNYSNATASGFFTMFVNDVSIAPGHTVALSAHVSGLEHTPEPASIVGLAVGAVGFLRRRKKV